MNCNVIWLREKKCLNYFQSEKKKFIGRNVFVFEVSADFPANNALLTLLNDSIKTATEVLSEHIAALDHKRTQNNKPQQYQPGDYVLYKLKSKKSKLQPIYSGPYKVLSHINNDVLAQHPCKSDPQTFHMEDLYLFFGTTEQAI